MTARPVTQELLGRVVAWAARRYPALWRDDPDEVRSAVGWALASGQRTEWVLNGEVRRRSPIGRGRARGGRPVDTVEFDGRVAAGVGEPHSVQGVAHLLEWVDPTGEQASARVDAATMLAGVHAGYRQVLWAYASGATPGEIADTLGQPVHWVENVVYGRVRLDRVDARTASEERRAALLEAAESGLAAGRSFRAVAREQACSATFLARLWREHCAPGLEDAA